MYLEWVFAFFQNQKTTTAIPDSYGRRKTHPKKISISFFLLVILIQFYRDIRLFNMERFCFDVYKGTYFTTEGHYRSH